MSTSNCPFNNDILTLLFSRYGIGNPLIGIKMRKTLISEYNLHIRFIETVQILFKKITSPQREADLSRREPAEGLGHLIPEPIKRLINRFALSCDIAGRSQIQRAVNNGNIAVNFSHYNSFPILNR